MSLPVSQGELDLWQQLWSCFAFAVAHAKPVADGSHAVAGGSREIADFRGGGPNRRPGATSAMPASLTSVELAEPIPQGTAAPASSRAATSAIPFQVAC